MRLKKVVTFLIILVLLFSSLSGCCFLTENRPEIGKWHGEVKLCEMTDSLAEEYQIILTLIAGSTAFEVDMEFYEDGTFYYVMNADKMKDSISNSVSTVAEFFIEEDISAVTDNIIDAVIQELLLGSDSECYGTYIVNGNSITAYGDNSTLYFEIKGNNLFQVDEYGDSILRFSKVKEG